MAVVCRYVQQVDTVRVVVNTVLELPHCPLSVNPTLFVSSCVHPVFRRCDVTFSPELGFSSRETTYIATEPPSRD